MLDQGTRPRALVRGTDLRCASAIACRQLVGLDAAVVDLGPDRAVVESTRSSTTERVEFNRQMHYLENGLNNKTLLRISIPGIVP